MPSLTDFLKRLTRGPATRESPPIPGAGSIESATIEPSAGLEISVVPQAPEPASARPESAASAAPAMATLEVGTKAPAVLPSAALDIDIDHGRAAMRWIEDGTYAVDLEPDTAITVMESADGGLATIPASVARVHPETVRAAVIEYVTTGHQPTAVTWRLLHHMD